MSWRKVVGEGLLTNTEFTWRYTCFRILLNSFKFFCIWINFSGTEWIQFILNDLLEFLDDRSLAFHGLRRFSLSVNPWIYINTEHLQKNKNNVFTFLYKFFSGYFFKFYRQNIYVTNLSKTSQYAPLYQFYDLAPKVPKWPFYSEKLKY